MTIFEPPRKDTAPEWFHGKEIDEVQFCREFLEQYTNNIYVSGKRVRGFVGIEVLSKTPLCNL